MLDAYELNKIIGAVLFAVLVMLGIGIVSDTIFDVEAPEKPGYAIEGAEAVAREEPAEAEAVPPLAARLAAASAEKGQTIAKKCTACHTFDAGGANRVGPNLHGVVGRDVASHEGFAYSDAMKAKEGPWSYEELEHFIEAPKNYVPGTAMAFAGIKKPADRADVILYLKSISPDAPPLPQPEAEAGGQDQQPESQAQ